MFQEMSMRKNHAVIHLGDNVYADSVWKAFSQHQIDTPTARDRLRQYYIRSYGEASQGRCMRRGTQLMMVDDHDFMDGYGKPDVCPSIALKTIYTVSNEI